MIEVVYNKEDETTNQPVTLPKNVRQVGETTGQRKIYIEDYAYNFIEDYPDEGKVCTGVLLGESRQQGKERFLFIKGAMKIENTDEKKEEIEFTESVWNAIYDGMHQYFPNDVIVGWYVIMNNCSTEQLELVRKIHMNHFAGNEKVVFLVEREEKCKKFYAYENNRLQGLNGYIIYYEKNEQMQNYLVEMRNGTRIEAESTEREKGNFRKLLKETAKDEPVVKKVFVSYVANAVMIVMILFAGVYIFNGRSGTSNTADVIRSTPVAAQRQEVTMPIQTMETMATVPIIEISGDVHPLPTELSGEISAETGEVVMPNEETSALETAVNAELKKYETYEIKKGETLISLSRKFYGNSSMIDAIMDLNGIKDRDQIYEGQIIKLP